MIPKIKDVKKIKILRVAHDDPSDVTTIEREVIDVDLVLIDVEKKEESRIWRLDRGARFGKYVNPILVSRAEKIELGDWYYNNLTKEYGQLIEWTKGYEKDCNGYYAMNCSKVVVFPEQFPFAELEAILKGELHTHSQIQLVCEVHDEWLKENPAFDNDRYPEYYQPALNVDDECCGIYYKKKTQKTYTHQEAKKIAEDYARYVFNNKLDASVHFDHWFQKLN